MSTRIEANARTDKPAAMAGQIGVYADGAIAGPAAYLKSTAFARCCERINDGTHVLLHHACNGKNPLSLLVVIIQTDYAAWAGMQDMLRRLEG